MNSAVRTALFVVSVLGIGVVIWFLSRSEPKRVSVAADSATAASAELAALAITAPNRAPESAPPHPALATDAAVRMAPSPEPIVSAAAPEPTDDALATTMHALEDTNPERALSLARQGQARWPAGPRAPEFAATEVKCLYRLGKPSEGRGAAEAMVNKYPSSPWALEVEKQTGAHPYVNH